MGNFPTHFLCVFRKANTSNTRGSVALDMYDSMFFYTIFKDLIKGNFTQNIT